MFKKTARRSTGSDPTLPAPVTSRLGTDASEPVSPRDHVEYESSSIPVISVEERNRHDDKILEAAQKGDTQKLKQLVEKKRFSKLHCNNINGCSPIVEACKFNRSECVEILMAADSDISECKDERGRTAVHLMAELGNSKIFTILAKKGADVDSTDGRGWTPLHLSAMNGHVAIVKTLLAYSSTVAARDDAGNSALILACKNSHEDVAGALIVADVDVNVVNARQRTALMFACELGLTKTTELLLRRGAKVNVKDADGQTARELAVIGGHDGCLAALPTTADRGNLSVDGVPRTAVLEKQVRELQDQLRQCTQEKDSMATRLRQSFAECETLRIQLSVFQEANDGGDDDDVNFDDDDSTVDLEESSGASDVAGFPKAAQDLIHSLRLELTATRLDMVTLSQQLQKLGVVPQSSRGVSLVNDVDVLRKENDRLRETMAAHSGDVVPLVLYEQVQLDNERQVAALRQELQEVTAAALAAAEKDIDY